MNPTTRVTKTLKGVFELLKESPFDIITLDLNLEDSLVDETLDAIPRIQAHDPKLLILILSGMDLTPEQAEKAAAADLVYNKLTLFREGFWAGLLTGVERLLVSGNSHHRENLFNAQILHAFAQKFAKSQNFLQSQAQALSDATNPIVTTTTTITTQ